MNDGSPLRLRGVVAAPRTLAAPKPVRRSHAVGLGLPRNHRVPLHGQYDVRLPGFAAGLANVLATIREGPAGTGLDPALADAAWAALLGSPAAVVPLRPPGAEDLLTNGHPAPTGSDGRLRAVALGVVVVPPTMRVDGGLLLDGPVACVARLTVLDRVGQPGLSEDAWFDARWVSSTTALATELESLRPIASQASAAHPDLKPMTLLIGDSLDDSFGPDAVALLQAVAYAHGYALSPLRRPRALRGPVTAALSSQRPSLLAVAARPEDGADEAVAAFAAATSPADVLTLRARDSPLADASADLREQLIRAAGVGPALTLLAPEPPLPPDLPDPGAAVRALDILVPPDQRAERRRHGKWGQLHLSSADGLWYTLTYAHSQHAGCLVKSYRRDNRTLRHHADYDADGKVILKHKGEEGAVIPWDETFGDG